MHHFTKMTEYCTLPWKYSEYWMLLLEIGFNLYTHSCACNYVHRGNCDTMQNYVWCCWLCCCDITELNTSHSVVVIQVLVWHVCVCLCCFLSLAVTEATGGVVATAHSFLDRKKTGEQCRIYTLLGCSSLIVLLSALLLCTTHMYVAAYTSDSVCTSALQMGLDISRICHWRRPRGKKWSARWAHFSASTVYSVPVR